MLEYYGIDVTDRQIALDMKLPYLFSCENGVYRSGPMLQTAEWFHLYLRPRGFSLAETELSPREACVLLQNNRPAMLGLALSPQGKHAVVSLGMENDRYKFLNNKREDSPAQELLLFTREELLPLLGDSVVIATLSKSPPMAVDLKPYFLNSADILLRLKQDIVSFCNREQSPQALKTAQNTMFRAILLDAITMLELLENAEPLKTLRVLQRELLTALQEDKPLTLSDRLSMNCFENAIDAYRKLILDTLPSSYCT